MTNLDADEVMEIMNIMEALVNATRDRVTRMNDTNFDGSEAKTVAELAAANRCTELKAAAYASNNLDGAVRRDACRFLKEFSPSPTFTETESATIMLTFDRSTAMQMALEGGDKWSDLHITLAYFPSVDDDDVEAIQDAVAQTASEFRPFVAKANGITRFSTDSDSPEDAKDAVVVNIDSWQINKIREDVLLHLKNGPAGLSESLAHGFTPHCTLGWIEPDEGMPLDRWQPLDARIVFIEVWRGDMHVPFKLGHPAPKTVEDGTDHPSDSTEDAIPQQGAVPMAKDVWTGSTGRRKVDRRKRIIQRAKRLGFTPAEERKGYLL